MRASASDWVGNGRTGFVVEVRDNPRYAHAMKWAWLIAILVLGGVCALPWTGDPRVALTNWSPPHETNSYLELASRFAPWKRSALGLSCGSDRQLRLVLRSRLPGPRWALKQGNTAKATIFIRDIGRKIEVPITLTATGAVDTLVSGRLSPSALHSLARSFGPTEPLSVDVMTMETGTFMRGRASDVAIQKMVSACTSAAANYGFRAVP